MLSCRTWRSSNTRAVESISLLRSTHSCHCSNSSGPSLTLASCQHFPPLISSLNQYPLVTSDVCRHSLWCEVRVASRVCLTACPVVAGSLLPSLLMSLVRMLPPNPSYPKVLWGCSPWSLSPCALALLILGSHISLLACCFCIRYHSSLQNIRCKKCPDWITLA